MNMTKEQKSTEEEEIELGSLFIIIGKGFSNLFRWIGSILKRIFNFFITILIFIKKHLLKLSIAAIVGGTLGTFFEIKKEELFTSDLLVKPNFKSTMQLYNNVNFYNELVKQKDTILLATIFKLNNDEAASLKSFKITPIIDDNDIITSYDDLIIEVDTLTSKNYSLEKYRNSFKEINYKVHQIKVVASNKHVFSKLDDIIISSVVENNYFKKIKQFTTENLQRTDSLLRQNLTSLDSLSNVYKTVLIEESKKQYAGTNIDFGSQKTTNKELQVFEISNQINSKIKDIVKEKSEQSEVINVISEFQLAGSRLKGVSNNLTFLGAVGAVFFLIIILLLLKLNRFLDNYKPTF